LSKVGAYRRLKYTKDIDVVFQKSGTIRPSKYNSYEWDAEPTKIVSGIPINPEYLDGVVVGDDMFDRYGRLMRYGERVALTRYRNKMRKKWRDSSKDIINRKRS
jgi:hypothetical protein